MRLSLRLAAACLGAVGHSASSGSRRADEVKNVAIIGAGAAGSSAAYHLQQYAAQERISINITVFEKTDRVGGRTLTVNAFDDPTEPIELGASIFVAVNHILYNATSKFGLPLGEMSTSETDDVTAIWDGDLFVYQSAQGSSWWWDVAKMWWRYGTSPYSALKLVRSVVGDFLKLYEEPWFPFKSLTERVIELRLERMSGVTGEQFLRANKINPKFSREILQAATRVNYASNLAYIHGLDAMVSSATEGAVAVQGGNWQIFDQMMQHSGAALYRNTSITSISFDMKSSPRKYLLSAKSSDAESTNFSVSFDDVVIASPWQYSDITAGAGVLRQPIDKIPYTKLHVTLFTSPFRLRPEFFGLPPGSKAPSSVYTTLGAGEEPKQGAAGVGRTGFYSISTLRTVTNPTTQRREYAYKIFSPEAVTTSFLAEILGADIPDTFTSSESDSPGIEPISWYYPASFHSYPIALPRVTFQDPVLGKGLYYTSGMESFISTMETSALMGMNVARLIADEMAGIERADVDRGEVRGEWAERDDFFERLEQDLGGPQEL